MGAREKLSTNTVPTCVWAHTPAKCGLLEAAGEHSLWRGTPSAGALPSWEQGGGAPGHARSLRGAGLGALGDILAVK